MPFAFSQNPLASLPSIRMERNLLSDSDLIISVCKQWVQVDEGMPLLPFEKTEYDEDAHFTQLGLFNSQRVLIHGYNDDNFDPLANGWLNLRTIAVEMRSDLASICAQSCALNHWHFSHLFCSRCGAKTILGKEHSRVCRRESCADIQFPRIDPSIIVAVINDNDEILLGHQKSWDKGRYSVLAGFINHGETLEQCVIREVREETGVKVDSVEYIASQPWPFPCSLMVGFHATAKKQLICPQDDEIQHAMWISRQALQEKINNNEITISNRFSISRYLIDRWLNNY